MRSIQKILSRCLNGEELACKELYQMFLPYSCGICQRYGVSQSDLKDQLQIIFSSTFKSLDKFDPSKASFKTWFTHICINKILEQRRKHKRQMTYDELPELDSSLIQDDTDSLDGAMDRAYFITILKQMPPRFQGVFNMFIIDGYTHKEIGAKLGITEGSSRVILKRARAWAKNALINYLKY